MARDVYVVLLISVVLITPLHCAWAVVPHPAAEAETVGDRDGHIEDIIEKLNKLELQQEHSKELIREVKSELIEMQRNSTCKGL